MNRINGYLLEIGFAGCILIGICGGCNLATNNHNIQGRRLYEQGQYQQAINCFQRSLAANPQNPDAYYNMGAVYYHLGKQQKNAQWVAHAQQLYSQAISLNPNHLPAYRGLAVSMAESGRVEEAFAMLQNWQQSVPYSEEPKIELARLAKETGDTARSTQYLLDALAINPQNPRALKAMGRLREEAGEYQLALQNYMRSYQVNNLQTDVAERIGALQGRLGGANSIPVNVQAAQPGQIRLGGADHYVPR